MPAIGAGMWESWWECRECGEWGGNAGNLGGNAGNRRGNVGNRRGNTGNHGGNVVNRTVIEKTK